MKCLIVDDDPLTCDTIESYLKRLGGLEYCLKADNGTTALHLLAAESFDAVFLDLELPGMDGPSLLRALPREVPVIVVSASKSFGADSYEFGIVDYLVKPIEFSRFAKAMVRLGERSSSSDDTTPRELFLRDGTTIQRIDLTELAYIQAKANYAEFVSTSGQTTMCLISMRRLEELLPDDFVRIHRSYLVSRQRIRRIEGNKVCLENSSLPIGQSYRTALLEKLGIAN